MEKCYLCPVQCGVDKIHTAGRCGVNGLTVAKAYLHPFEEPALSPNGKSGAIFFGGCSLRCVFCQNYEVSRAQKGKRVTPKELTDIFKRLEDEGAENIDLVTCDHVSDLIGEALALYKPRVPVVYNSSSYALVGALKQIDAYIDVYLPDVKFYSPELALRYTGRGDYFEVAAEAVRFMAQKRVVFEGTRLLSGMIVRHLVLPCCTGDSLKILEFLKETLPPDAPVSLMRQFTPNLGKTDYPELSRTLTAREYSRVKEFALSLGFENLYLQDKASASAAFVPDWAE